MSQRLLCVDDDPNILQAYQRSLHKRFTIDTALSGRLGLEAIECRGPYAVVVADMRMPEMNGVEFLAHVRRLTPETVRMMLTGNADQQTAMEAVNEGQIFRFMTKPCPPDVFAKVIEAGLEQYRLVTAERELLTKTLAASVKLLTEVLGLVNPTAFGRASRVRQLVQQLCAELDVEPSWPVEVAAMLSQIGCITVPDKILAKVFRGDELAAPEREIYQQHPRIAYDLLVHIPRLEHVAEIVGYQDKLYNGQGFPIDYRSGDDIPLGSRILKVALDWDMLLRPEVSEDLAMANLLDRPGWYDPNVLRALQRVLKIDATYVAVTMRVNDLVDGMILAEDVRSMAHTLLCARGQEVTPAIRLRLRNYVVNVGFRSPVKVLIPADEAARHAS